VQAYVSNLANQIKDMTAEAGILQDFQQKLQFEPANLNELDDVLLEIELKELLWSSWSSIQENTTQWASSPFFEVMASVADLLCMRE
jgi:hypothetical protein